ncbi:hypothetical protein G7062_00050 [Erysipelothrix sp. HDW6C]|uniref:hypothetical protein n=1 Tax=Erysipelothrix sp. HDW6C TaxID=2714930 RepID=UPI00140D1BC9|nr:hypothetical protein [Erysipelothrix sp. HDW6C]QIK68767.1 hypothetical protein G7062_00050 [Erysipelothrix sp. HDW6C]
MTDRERVDELIFNSNDPYISTNGIRHYMGIPQNDAKRLFDVCKKYEELEANKRLKKLKLNSHDVDWKPTRVKISTLFAIEGLNYRFELNRYKQRKEKE